MATKSVPHDIVIAPHNNVLKPLLVGLAFMFLLVYGLVAFNTGDPLWLFGRTAVPAPIRIIIINEGERHIYEPSDPEFNQLAPLIEQGITSLNNNALVGIGLSDGTLYEYNNNQTILEVHYSAPIDFRTSFPTENGSRLLIPLYGSHAGNGLFFRGEGNDWYFGALRMSDPAPLYTALRELGYPVQSR
jgi:hypothetical protein